MSRKLATAIKESAIPGKYKRILEAYASFANNDGTNIRPSQKQLGKRAGTSDDTVQRNTPDLLASTILRRAETHTCKVSSCNKGSWHFTGTWGRSTKVYEIQIENMQNAASYLTAKCDLVNAAKCRKVKAAKCGTTQALRTTPVPSSPGITDNSSVLANGLVSKEVSEAPLASLTTSLGQENQKPPEAMGALPEQTKPSDDLWSMDSEQAWLKQEPIPYWSDALGRGLEINEVVIAEELYLDLIATGNMHEADVVTLAEITLAYQTDHQHGQAVIRQVWHWNHLHKKESLRFRTIQGLAKAMRSGSDNNIVIQWNEHNTLDCPKCKKLRKCVQCGLLDDGTEIDPGRDYPDTYLHKGCYWSWIYEEPTYQDKMRQPANVCCAMSYNSDGAGHVPTCPNYKEPANSFAGTKKGSCMKCMSQGITICECDGCCAADGPNPGHSAMAAVSE
jgi:hypothetical protein